MASLMRYINRTSRCFTLYRNNCLENRGINGYQHLYVIRICQRPGILQDELVREIYVNKSSVARQLSLLEQNGWIRREPCEEDRRQLRVYPTEKAMEIFPEVLEVRTRWNQALLEEFSPEEQQQLCAMLERVEKKAERLLQPCGKEDGE